jgi:prolyl-tRNA synthetase
MSNKREADSSDAKVKIARRSEDFPRWYTDVIAAADLADYSPVKGCMVIKPYGYAIWENIQKNLDRMFKETGHQNAYFPLFIPEEFLKREAEHVEGFSPELAVVTHAGGKKLEEPLIVRPTSETIINDSFSKWIKSWRDLPLLINQWANVVRWEMRTRLFLRTTEFLWQEGHTAHATHEESREEVQRMLGVYKTFVQDYLAIPVLTGKKSDSEKFAGALETYAIEGMMQDRKALQCGTSHDLGQNFAKAFNIRFQDEKGELQYVWQTSWGVSTRLIGGMIMAHGDDKGIVIPPEIAPIQVVFVPIWQKDEDREKVMELCHSLSKSLLSLPCKVDDRDNYRPAWKFFEWERKGVPVRVEIGPKDVEKGQVVIVRRDNGEKAFIPVDQFKERLRAILDTVQDDLFARALKFREDSTITATAWDDFAGIFEGPGGFVRAAWCGDADCEAQMKEKAGATIRVLLPAGEMPGNSCVHCKKEARHGAVFARSY